MERSGRRWRQTAVPRARLGLLLLAAVLLISGLGSLVVRAPPPIPMTTQGHAYDRAGSPLAAGTLIRTFLDGVDYSNDTSVLDATGSYSAATQGNLVINGTTPEPSPVKTGPNRGEQIVYAAGNFTAQAAFFQEVTPWSADTTVTQDLHLGSLASTPNPLRIQGLVTQPARGGAGYVDLCNPMGFNVSLADYYLQRDAPGTYYGGNLSLTGTVAADGQARVNLTPGFGMVPTGDALKLVYRNPGGAGAAAGGSDLIVDRVEFNATVNGTLDWQPGNTILGDAPAPGPGQILERSPFCSPASAPGAFRLATEPGLPAAAPPSVTITAPAAGGSVQGGQVLTIRWNMTDPVFVATYLRVWVNVTYQGTTRTLVAGAPGVTAVDWNVPDISAAEATIRVSVVNPFGAEGNATTTFDVVRPSPFSVLIAILVIIVIAVFIGIAYVYAKRQERPPPAPPPAVPAAPPAPPPAAPAAVAAPGTKVCPKCGTRVQEADSACFYCGHPFDAPPP